jgi:DNA polymerase (family 10)
MTNKEISAQFSTLAKLLDIHGENSFKSKSYTNAAFAIGKLPFEIEEAGIEAVEGQFGIGKSIIESILRLLDGEELSELSKLLKNTPTGILELLNIRGIGPKKIGQLWRELSVESPEDLLKACQENQLISLKGFAAKTQSAIEEKIEFYFENKGHLLWSQAEQIMPSIEKMLSELCQDRKYKVLGDFYWQNETVASFSVLMSATNSTVTKNDFDFLPKEDWEFQHQSDKIFHYRYRGSLGFQFRSVAEDDFEKEKFLYSFSEEIRNELDVSKIIAFDDEHKIFSELGMEYMPPYLRNNVNAFNQAQTGLPQIIELDDIKGVIHNHSQWSDGVHTIEEMAQACMDRGYEYFVLSDHSKTSSYAGGLSEERIVQQQKEIDVLNQKLKPFRIFKSIECDILGDGSLDYSDEVLASFDVVVCSVHQNLTMKEDKAMSRLLAAIENPYSSILGHMTGRLLTSRQGYPLDHKKIIDACAANEVAIEINANPRRLDMDWRWIDYAMKKDVLLSINPDAHRMEGIDDIRYGVLVAQKGMLSPAMNVSSFSLDEFEEWLMTQHEKRN